MLNTYKKAYVYALDLLALVIDFTKFYVDSDEIDSAVSLCGAFLKQHPENEVVANNLAVSLVNYKDDQESLDFVAELARCFRNLPVPMSPVVWVGHCIKMEMRLFHTESVPLRAYLAPQKCVTWVWFIMQKMKSC